jgi:hypothetical protein
MELDGLPTLIEVKTANPKLRRSRDRISLTEDWYRKKLHPFQEIYPGRNEFGLVIITLPEFFNLFPEYHAGFNPENGMHFYTINTTWEKLNQRAKQTSAHPELSGRTLFQKV